MAGLTTLSGGAGHRSAPGGGGKTHADHGMVGEIVIE
jgi:hypothetical protein